GLLVIRKLIAINTALNARLADDINRSLFLDQRAEGAFGRNRAAPAVNTVGQNDDRFAPFDLAQLLARRQIERVIEFREHSGPQTIERALQGVPAGGPILHQFDLVIETDPGKFIFVGELVDEAQAGLFEVFELVRHAAASVYHDDDMNRHPFERERTDGLRGTVFKDGEIFRFQIGYELSRKIAHGDGQQNLSGVNRDYGVIGFPPAILLLLFSLRRLRLLCASVNV